MKWTRRTTERIAAELGALDIAVCPNTVAKLLKALDYRLRVNHKKLHKGSVRDQADRDCQFGYIAARRRSFARRGLPVVSIDSKHRELVGNFKNPGAAWGRQPRLVNDHDFPSDADGVALPYGIYDVGANLGYVFVGTSHDTPDFAADNLGRWWSYQGCRLYPEADEVLVLADSGGSNGNTKRAWKAGLQRVSDRCGLRITVCHYPTSASKWNPIEHRLLSEISKNWAGVPLTDYETILNYIRTTRTKTGLRVKAYLVQKDYPTGVKITNEEMAELAVAPHKTQPARNYTISPR
jgi:hypothetical protein